MAYFKLKSGKYTDGDGNRYVPGDVIECQPDEIPVAFADLWEKLKDYKPEQKE